jgi:hypothetical protein
MPKGLLLLNKSRRKKPATVGGKTMGSVRSPSATARTFGLAWMTFLAAKIPRKKEMIVATTPVFREM